MNHPDLKNIHVTVLAAGPDAERAVSIQSGTAIAKALRTGGAFGQVDYLEINRFTPDDLSAIRTDVFFPALHGPYGEGGPLQELLEDDGRPFVGSGAVAARAAMDKTQSKQIAKTLGIPIAESAELEPAHFEPAAPLPPPLLEFPFVIKPIADGSSVNIFICKTNAHYEYALECLRNQFASAPGAVPRYMIEKFVPGRELTVGIVGTEISSIIEIIPSVDFYDYAAKYDRDDTDYRIDPDLPPAARSFMLDASLQLFNEMQCCDLARIDFRFDDTDLALSPSETCIFLEINTMPGFTSHSLVPMGALKMQNCPMPQLCTRLVELALCRAAREQK